MTAAAHQVTDSPDGETAFNQEGGYDRVFWLAFLANASVMVLVSMMARYADFVSHLGGGEFQLGLIVGAGAIGSIAMRLAQGVWMDRYGSRVMWLVSTLVLFASMAGHLLVTRADSPFIFLLRAGMMIGVAGAFGASMTFISSRVPPRRMAEMIGMLGVSGFVGMFLGPQIGDLICRGPIGREQLNLLFLCAAGVASIAFLAAWGATWRQPIPQLRRRPPLLTLLRKYHPGIILLVAAAMGGGLSLPNTFLRPFTVARQIDTVGLFFATYAVTALSVRIATRRLPERWGNRRVILLGVAMLSLALLLYLPVRETWQLVFPALATGVAHGLLFPAVVASIGTSFPPRYRGLGATLALAMFDIGNLTGAPLVGGLLRSTASLGLPPYLTTFPLVAALMAGVALVYGLRTRERAFVAAEVESDVLVNDPHVELSYERTN